MDNVYRVSIQFVMHLDSWEKTSLEMLELGCNLSISYATFMLSQLSTCIRNWMDTH